MVTGYPSPRHTSSEKKEKVSSQQLSMFDKHEDVTDETQLENKASKRGLS